MNIILEYTNVTASERLEAIIEEKITTLKVKFPFVIRADIFLKKENFESNGDKHCGIRLSLPGPRIFASSDEVSFESAISKTIKDLNIQLKKRKELHAH